MKRPGQRPFPDDSLDSLVTCAIARSQADAEWLAETYADRSVIDAELLSETGLWDDASRTAAHDLLRRLLLRRLAQRQSTTPTWTTVCRRLRDRHTDSGSRDYLYYALAAGDIGAVARELATDLSKHDGGGQDFLGLLTSVATAPCDAADPGEGSPYQRQLDLAETVTDDGTPHLVPLSRLLAGLFIANDPWTRPDRADLHGQIAIDYRQIAPHADRPAAVREEAKRHDALARYWS